MKAVLVLMTCIVANLAPSHADDPMTIQWYPRLLTEKKTETLLTSPATLVVNPWNPSYSLEEESRYMKKVPLYRKGFDPVDALGPDYWKIIRQSD